MASNAQTELAEGRERTQAVFSDWRKELDQAEAELLAREARKWQDVYDREAGSGASSSPQTSPTRWVRMQPDRGGGRTWDLGLHRVEVRQPRGFNKGRALLPEIMEPSGPEDSSVPKYRAARDAASRRPRRHQLSRKTKSYHGTNRACRSREPTLPVSCTLPAMRQGGEVLGLSTRDLALMLKGPLEVELSGEPVRAMPSCNKRQRPTYDPPPFSSLKPPKKK